MNNIIINAAVINGQLKTSREHIIVINAVKVTMYMYTLGFPIKNTYKYSYIVISSHHISRHELDLRS